ncbi:transcription termination factor MTERF2, chloroplastic-like [Phoenix dactylifera]|uniref:Transcription termination factor MTERF2, chloroplastic-like n=1 Tax=Phoenix dactylifera TaxID=42345 RepID=A0A8B8ZIM0_PHODC|nr:transcription termination factor MTERF2, chloroplastic-like [Phoenix dactylifera]XP_038973142.1 transcription termination factor MTERF2, chloroplastic-like [Phoenix dactylifera]
MLLQRRLFYLLPYSAPRITTLAPFSHHLLISILRFSAPTTQTPSPTPPFIVEFLLNSCGLSSSKAIEASKHLAHFKSPAQPTSVIQFLQQLGLSDSHIRISISKCPRLLCANVEKTLRPKIRSLREMGFSEAELGQLISANPNVLRVRNPRPKIEFWRDFFSSNEELFKAIGRDAYLLSSSLSKRIIPNISLLRECCIPDHRIAKMMLSTRFVARKPSLIQAAVKRADELGVPRSSGSFPHLLQTVFNISQSTVDAKLKLFKSLGWSEAEFLSAMPKNPVLLRLSEKNVRDKMDFFMKEVGCELGYIVRRPVLLSYSLERRLIPRHLVLRTLKHEGLPGGTRDLLTAILFSEKSFIEKFVLPYRENVPGLHEAYVVACAGKAPI